jgi:catechol 2,3-dioxygenase-like lactoylglutathione lyase family enzyme/nitrite reductase/ring-hydroxylating ferredoxin subunit
MTGGQMHHLVLDVAELERSEQFYGETLGLAPVGRDLWPGDGPTSTYRLGASTYLVLQQVADPRPDPPGVHIRFDVPAEEWDEIVERFVARGHQLKDERKAGLRAVGENGLNATDPDGHVIELESHGPAAFEFPAAGRGKVVAGRVEDFAVGSVTRIPQGQFFLIRLPEGFLALSQVCTHMQFAITYQSEHYRFYCPRHRRRFTRNGQYISRFGEYNDPLRTYTVEIVNNQIVVDTDTSHPRTTEEAKHPDLCGLPLPMGQRLA